MGKLNYGTPSLPASLNLCIPGSEGHKVTNQHDESMSRNIEQCLLATCVGTLSELGDLVSQAVHHWYNKTTHGNGASPSNRRQHLLSWGREALHVLHYYMRCPELDTSHRGVPHFHLHRARLSTPPLMEWIRVAAAHTEHRNSRVVDGNDVSQAARLLLPGIDCPHRLLEPGETLCASRQLDAGQCVARFQLDMAFRILSCGRSDTVPHALALLGKEGVNARNDQGMTPLMYACARGDEAMVHILLDSGAALDIAVPTDTLRYSSIDSETKSWTALTFATVQGHIAIVQLLLERGATVEGAHKVGGENYSETPLQLAAATGHYELVCLLLTRGADPYLTTTPRNGISFTYSFGGHSAFSLAAAHGHRNVIQRLLAQKVSDTNDVLSLEEMLAEGATDTFKNRYNIREKLQPSSQQDLNNKLGSDNGSANSENIYVTIDEVLSVDGSHQEEPPTSKLTRTQNRVLQESMYQAAEHGFLNIALELKNLGVPWNSYTWGRCLEAAYNMRRTSLLLSLLADFSRCHLEADCGPSFVSQCLPLLFDILKRKKREPTAARMVELLCHIYGQDVIPEIPPPIQRPPTRIDPRFVNNPELSDIQFMIEGHIFYAHKIILVNASNRFRAMLSNKFAESSQPVIEINDVRYHIFQHIMEYLYNGGSWTVHVESHDEILELLGAANFFLLDGLQHHCERLCAGKVTADNCTHIYKQAKLYNAVSLMSYCEGFFLQGMPALLKSNESFSKLLFSSKLQSYDLINGLLATLGQRLTDRLHTRNRHLKVVQL
ncbi:hypothetical protein NP493_597g03031 [Ridgeia piscesae]|uniref:BTB domain-containing protein n=1 Tax=Ridgeia piscesae TaxID=27915 RepID=A0AAD9NR28_RIDPI|nr:hypothetical protein NP493_597g03031 [Ridgeia piscesae]